MATQARAKELVILEVQVDVQGVVKSVRVLRGHPLFDEPAMDAVRQWRAAAAERRADRIHPEREGALRHGVRLELKW